MNKYCATESSDREIIHRFYADPDGVEYIGEWRHLKDAACIQCKESKRQQKLRSKEQVS